MTKEIVMIFVALCVVVALALSFLLLLLLSVGAWIGYVQDSWGRRSSTDERAIPGNSDTHSKAGRRMIAFSLAAFVVGLFLVLAVWGLGVWIEGLE